MITNLAIVVFVFRGHLENPFARRGGFLSYDGTKRAKLSRLLGKTIL
jgi:hypothetical protein